MDTSRPPMRARRTPLRALAAALVVAGGLGVAACGGEGQAWGDVNSIIVVTDSSLWNQVKDTLYSALEPRILTVRNERTFKVTFQQPNGQYWGNLRRFRQLLLIGTGEEEWMQKAVAKLDSMPSKPAIAQVGDVWADGQGVTMLLVPKGDEAQAVRSKVGELHDMYDQAFRQYAVNRMFLTGRDSALADSLTRQAGFSLLVPNVYSWDRKDSVYIFRNDNPDPSELIRQVAVTWKSPIPGGLQPEDLLAWRKDISENYYENEQAVNLDLVDAGPFKYRGHDAYQIQAIWENPPNYSWPAAGPFILRAVICRNQDRMYLLDAWLYAPGKEKYEYMLQLQNILDSFRCGPGEATAMPTSDNHPAQRPGAPGPAGRRRLRRAPSAAAQVVGNAVGGELDGHLHVSRLHPGHLHLQPGTPGDVAAVHHPLEAEALALTERPLQHGGRVGGGAEQPGAAPALPQRAQGFDHRVAAAVHAVEGGGHVGAVRDGLGIHGDAL